jgi:hypothetical protein
MALFLPILVTSCTYSTEDKFRMFVNEAPAEAGNLDLSSFIDWDEASLRCPNSDTAFDENDNLDLGQLTLYLDGEVVLDYVGSATDRIIFCPDLKGQHFEFAFPDGVLSLVRTGPVETLLGGENIYTYIYPPAR